MTMMRANLVLPQNSKVILSSHQMIAMNNLIGSLLQEGHKSTKIHRGLREESTYEIIPNRAKKCAHIVKIKGGTMKVMMTGIGMMTLKLGMKQDREKLTKGVEHTIVMIKTAASTLKKQPSRKEKT